MGLVLWVELQLSFSFFPDKKKSFTLTSLMQLPPMCPCEEGLAQSPPQDELNSTTAIFPLLAQILINAAFTWDIR